MRAEPEERGGSTEAWFARETLATWYTEAYKSTSPTGHLFASRLRHIERLLADCEGGALLDAGCGPGMVIRYLMERRPRAFRFSGIDQSAPMIEAARRNVQGKDPVDLRVGRVERLPFPDAAFDVALAIGVIEYVDASVVLAELSRVVRRGSTVIASMLNPMSPYRIWQQSVYEPARTLWRRARGDDTAPASMRLHRRQAYCRLLEASGLQPLEVVHYDFNVFPSPLDRRFPALAVRINETIERAGGSRLAWLGTGYIVKARKA